MSVFRKAKSWAQWSLLMFGLASHQVAFAETCNCSEIGKRARAANDRCAAIEDHTLLSACISDTVYPLQTEWETCLAAPEVPKACPLEAGEPPVRPPDCGYVREQGSDIPVTFNEDTMKDFIDAIMKEMETGGINGPHNDNEVEVTTGFNEQGKMDQLQVKHRTRVVVPRIGNSRAPEQLRDLMKQGAEIMMEHERGHRDAAGKVLKQLACAAWGKSDAQVAVLVKEMKCVTMPAAQRAWDAKGGQLAPIIGPDGKATGMASKPLILPKSAYIPEGCPGHIPAPAKKAEPGS